MPECVLGGWGVWGAIRPPFARALSATASAHALLLWHGRAAYFSNYISETVGEARASRAAGAPR
jgi:hypothetical protein